MARCDGGWRPAASLMPGERHQLRIIEQGMNHSPVELRSFGVGEKRLVLLAMNFTRNLRAFGQLRAEPQRQRRHALPFEIDRHVGCQLIDTGLLCAVGRAMHVAPGAEG
jgi:hypothetical protein